MDKFISEHAGKMNFYLSVVDDRLRHPSDAPSIGIILCQTENRLVAEYALRDLNKPIGVSAYQIIASLPAHLEGSLPTIEQLEAQLQSFPVEDPES